VNAITKRSQAQPKASSLFKIALVRLPLETTLTLNIKFPTLFPFHTRGINIKNTKNKIAVPKAQT